jgi:hypothetical protein
VGKERGKYSKIGMLDNKEKRERVLTTISSISIAGRAEWKRDVQLRMGKGF